MALLLTVLSGPAAYAAAPQAPPAALTAAEAQQMQQADQAVSALTDSPEFAALEPEARMQAAVDCLRQLSEDGLVQPGSIYADMENDLVSYAYTCGAWGGVLLETPELENFELGEPPLFPAPSRRAQAVPPWSIMLSTMPPAAPVTLIMLICRHFGPLLGWTPGWTRL